MKRLQHLFFAVFLIGASLAFASFHAEQAQAQTLVPCPTPGTNITITGTIMPQCVINGGATAGPQATPTGGNCIAISTPPAAGSIAYTCPTPYPTPTATSANGNCTVSGLVITCTTPSAAPAPTAPFLGKLLADANTRHVWPMDVSTPAAGATPTACPSSVSIPDAIGGGATAVPSPVALTGVNSTKLQCGRIPLVADGNASIGFCMDTSSANSCNGNTSAYVSIPTTVTPATPGAYAVGFIYEDAGVSPEQLATLWSLDGVDNIELYTSRTADSSKGMRAGGSTVDFAILDTRPHMTIYNYDGTHSYICQDGRFLLVNQAAPLNVTGAGGIGTQLVSGPGSGFQGYVQYVWVHGGAYTQDQCSWLYQQTGFN
jgi:hypothetical protein